MKKIIVDTDVLIDYSKGYRNHLENLLKKQNQAELELYVTPINVAEFFTDKNLADPEKHAKAKEFFTFFRTIEITKNTGLVAGELLRNSQTHYLGDALVAASCLISQAVLYTRNKAHFSQVAGLKLYENQQL